MLQAEHDASDWKSPLALASSLLPFSLPLSWSRCRESDEEGEAGGSVGGVVASHPSFDAIAPS